MMKQRLQLQKAMSANPRILLSILTVSASLQSLLLSLSATALLYCRGCPHCAGTTNASIPSKEHKTAWATVYCWCWLRTHPQGLFL
ncbi:hypothetical protein GJAV_G00190220 [Gymnothorax javanicus]|nr:hypothetical protein GJAV_G00190220 [Gymnothorax javanicus]